MHLWTLDWSIVIFVIIIFIIIFIIITNPVAMMSWEMHQKKRWWYNYSAAAK